MALLPCFIPVRYVILFLIKFTFQNLVTVSELINCRDFFTRINTQITAKITQLSSPQTSVKKEANPLQPSLSELFGIKCWSKAWWSSTQIIKQSKRCYTWREIKLQLLDSSGLPGQLSRVSLMQPIAALAIN